MRGDRGGHGPPLGFSDYALDTLARGRRFATDIKESSKRFLSATVSFGAVLSFVVAVLPLKDAQGHDAHDLDKPSRPLPRL